MPQESDTPKTVDYRLELDDGKYTYIRYREGGQEALRYGEPWRELDGDNLIYFFGCKVEQLERELSEAKMKLQWISGARDILIQELSEAKKEIERLKHFEFLHNNRIA